MTQPALHAVPDGTAAEVSRVPSARWVNAARHTGLAHRRRSAVGDPAGTVVPLLRRPRVHEHDWRVVCVDFEAAGQVTEHRCLGCDDVLFT